MFSRSKLDTVSTLGQTFFEISLIKKLHWKNCKKKLEQNNELRQNRFFCNFKPLTSKEFQLIIIIARRDPIFKLFDFLSYL